MLSLLKKIHYRLGEWIERLEERQPKAPCDPLVAADVARLSRRIYEHSQTVNPYADMISKMPFPDRVDAIRIAQGAARHDEEKRCSICGEKLENCSYERAVKE